ncbi:MAG: FkbM family methyltransferase [Terriglobales bacterium]
MYLKSILLMASLMTHFRNGRTLVARMRAGEPWDEVVRWDGTVLSHPIGRGGFLEAIVEVWLQHTYTSGFYSAADGDVIVDAGANVGIFAIQMARQNRRCRVIALEPFPENFKYLEANVARARLGNITCCEMALGAAFSRGHMQAHGSRSLDHVLQLDSTEADGMPVIPLGGLFALAQANLAGTQEIALLKVDIEGSEHDVFAAAPPDLLVHFKRIAMEYHDQIVPGTLDLLRRVLKPTHEINVRPSKMEGCGILLARRRDLPQ